MTVYDELYLGCNPAHQRRMRHHKRKTAQLSAAALDGAKDAIELLLTMCGMMCLWSGLMDIAEQGGLTAVLARAFSPVLKLLFPDYKTTKKLPAQSVQTLRQTFWGWATRRRRLELKQCAACR